MSEASSASLYLGRAQCLAEEVVKSFDSRGKMLAAAESCTAGLTADFITRIPGASKVFWGSFVCYTPDAKIKMLGLTKELIEKHGAVSKPVALAMAEAALEKSGAHWAFSVTGLAGPGGDNMGTPVGTIWIGLAERDRNISGSKRSEAKMFLFSGTRNELREAAAAAALEELLKQVSASETSSERS